MSAVGALALVMGGLVLAYTGRELARSAEEDDLVGPALLALGLFVLGAVALIAGIMLMVSLGA